jgi:hypothetical protein
MGDSKKTEQEAMSNGKQSLDKNLRTLNKYSRADVLGNDFRNFAADFRKNVTRLFCCNMRKNTGQVTKIQKLQRKNGVMDIRKNMEFMDE